LVDDEDYYWLIQWKWYAQPRRRTFYARRTVNPKDGEKAYAVMMHRAVLGFPECQNIDHRNDNGLDNQKHNLRECTISENTSNMIASGRNTSGFKGVDWHKNNKKYRARINVCNKEIHIGFFVSKIEAAKAYDEKAKELHGKFARLNFPEFYGGGA